MCGINMNRLSHALIVTIRCPVAFISFKDVPAIILSSLAGCRLVIDFLPAALTHVPDVKVAAQSVERKPPGIPQSQRPDLRSISGNANEGIILRD